MKKVIGGVNEPVNCTASATCANGRTFSCAGNTHTGADGSALGCSAQDRSRCNLLLPRKWVDSLGCSELYRRHGMEYTIIFLELF